MKSFSFHPCPLVAVTVAVAIVAVARTNANALEITNPSGTCTEEEKYGTSRSTNGARPTYHVPDDGDTYLPNCNNPLQRELWRVFVKQAEEGEEGDGDGDGDGTVKATAYAYMIPRPDENLFSTIVHGSDLSICDGIIGDDMRKMAMLYGLCSGRESESDSDGNAPTNTDSGTTDTDTDTNIQWNSMEPAHALAFSTLFHRRLQFSVSGDMTSIVPWVPDEDILLACDNANGTANGISSALQSYCDAVEQRCNDDGICIEEPISSSSLLSNPEILNELASALNDLYGVGIVGDVCDPKVWGSTFPCAVAGCVAPPPESGCTYQVAYAINGDYDCCEKLCNFVDGDGEECVYTSGGSIHTLSSTRTSIVVLALLVMIFSLGYF